MDLQTEFSKEVLRLIKKIPKGRVATYGFIANLAGNPRGARGVGWLLHSCTRSHNLPWQRVIKSDGQLAFPFGSPQYSLQKKLLEREGVMLDKGRVNLRSYLWEL